MGRMRRPAAVVADWLWLKAWGARAVAAAALPVLRKSRRSIRSPDRSRGGDHARTISVNDCRRVSYEVLLGRWRGGFVGTRPLTARVSAALAECRFRYCPLGIAGGI